MQTVTVAITLPWPGTSPHDVVEALSTAIAQNTAHGNTMAAQAIVQVYNLAQIGLANSVGAVRPVG